VKPQSSVWGMSRIALLFSVLSALPALGQRTEIPIYKGDPSQQAGIVLMPWGSGDARDSEEYIRTGSRSIRITSHGAYQGAQLILRKPVDIKSASQNPSAYLQFVMQLPAQQTRGGLLGGLRGGLPPDIVMGIPGGIPGTTGRTGRARSGGRRGRDDEFGLGPGLGTGTQRTGVIKPKPLENVRVVLVTTDNRQIEVLLPTENARPDNLGWTSLAVPLVAIPGLKESSGQIKEIRIFGDTPSTLYLGEARVVYDETPIRVDPLPEVVIPANSTVTFTASATAGASLLKYEWDFDTQGEFQPDAEGRVVKHKYRKSREGDYIVTLRVSDIYGVKKPVMVTTKVHVTL
jgi:hypothetical protein